MSDCRLNYKVFFFGIFIFVVSSSFTFAQNKKKYEINTSEQYDSLVYKALALFQEPRMRYNLDAIPVNKCGLSIQFELHRRKKELSQNDKNILSVIFSKEVMDKSVLSPKGNFRIHYNTSGYDAPDLTDNDNNGIPDFVDSVAYYFEYSLDALTNKIGIQLNIKDICIGEEYDVYILALTRGIYGYTEFDDDGLLSKEGELPRYSSSITIDNDFNGFYTS